MKAITFDTYGSADVLQLRELDKPLVKDDEVLVRVRAASANPFDWHFMTGLPYLMRLMSGLFKPKCRRLGADLAGQVEAVGKSVTKFRPGDEVFGEVDDDGAASFAEYVSVSENAVVPKPANLTFEQAAAAPMVGMTALQALRDHGRLEPGQQVLINGASGGVGTFAVQIAKSLGAEVTGVCSGRNVEMVRSIGADHVIDYTREDFTRSAPRYDLVLDNVGNRTLSECRRVLKPKGVYLMSFGCPERRWVGPMIQLLTAAVMSMFVSQKMLTFVTRLSREDLLALKELIEAGQLTPVIDKTYSLAETADAMRHLDTGHVRGKVVISM